MIHKTILIHAGQRTDGSDAAIKNPYLTKEQILYKPDEIINGAILGSAFVNRFGLLSEFHSHQALIDCSSVYRFGLYLTDITPFSEPIPVKGEMGIWYYDLENQCKFKKIK